ncbi:unnamed protein product, partial [Candidula unifasciata]
SHFILAAGITLLLAASLIVGIVFVAKEHGSSEPSEDVSAVFKNAAVAADSTLCSEVGKNILLKGGNAVDAAIATLLCSGLTSAQSMGIGGGFFMTIYNNIGVPGEIKGYWLAHQKYGSLPWKDLFEPAINMSQQGFPVPKSLHDALLSDEKTVLEEPSLKAVFVNPKTGYIFKEGETMTRPQLAVTLKIISDNGSDAFYSGSLADSILQDLKEIGSIITRLDLQNYEAWEKKPLEIVLNGGIKLVSPPPPASGAVLSFILNILDGYNFTAGDLETDTFTTLTYHRIVEAFKFAYAKRTDLGDEKFENVTELVRNLTSKAYADSIRTLITDNATHGYEYYGPTFYDRDTTGTSHLSVVDQQGNAVSVTSTINGRFENKCLRRILMCPAVLVNTDGSVNMIVGAAGGSKITTATAWVSV